jgi:hypothetical protein
MSWSHPRLSNFSYLCSRNSLSPNIGQRVNGCKENYKTTNWLVITNFSLVSLGWLWLPLWSSDQGSWLRIQWSGFDSRRYHISWEVVGLERGPLSTIEELLERKSSNSVLRNRDYGLGIRRADHVTPLYPQKLEVGWPTSGGRSVGIVRSRTQATEFSFSLMMCLNM